MLAALLARLNLRSPDGNVRRLAAIVFVLLAVVSALGSAGHSHGSMSQKPVAGEVAVQVTLADGGAGRTFLHPGDRIDLITDSPSARLPGVRVLQVLADQQPGLKAFTANGDPPGTELVVAVDAAHVSTIGAFATRRVFAARAPTP